MVNQSAALVAENDDVESLLAFSQCRMAGDAELSRPDELFSCDKHLRVAPLLHLRPDVLANALLAVSEGRLVPEEEAQPVEMELPTLPDYPEPVTPQPVPEVEERCEIEQIADEPEPFVERRALPRRTGTAVVRVVRVPASGSMTSQQRNWELHGTPLRGELEEISLHSVACLLGEPFSPGEAVYVRMTNPRTHRTLDVPAEVVRVRFLNGDDRWKVVYRLQRSLTLCELHEFAYASEPLAVGDLEEANAV